MPTRTSKPKSKTVVSRGRRYWRAAKEFKPAAKKRKKKPPRTLARRRWVEVPVPPTDEMLRGMTEATFLNDGSLMEMQRRFNGMLDCIPKRRRKR